MFYAFVSKELAATCKETRFFHLDTVAVVRGLRSPEAPPKAKKATFQAVLHDFQHFDALPRVENKPSEPSGKQAQRDPNTSPEAKPASQASQPATPDSRDQPSRPAQPARQPGQAKQPARQARQPRPASRPAQPARQPGQAARPASQPTSHTAHQPPTYRGAGGRRA